MKHFIKIVSLVLCLAMCAALFTACSGKESSSSGPKKAVIGVALYQDGGPAPTATKAFLEEVGKKLNMTFVYTVLTQTDENANLTKIQELIAAKVDGIICTMDMATESILNECADAGVYLAGYLCDYDTSFTQNYDKVFKHSSFLGTVADGNCSDVVTTGKDYFDTLLEYNKKNPDNPILHVAMTTFPPFAFPQHQAYAQQFVECVEEYNKTAETKITVDPFDEETDILMFAPMDSTYFSKHPDIDAIMGFCAGKFIYGTVISAGKADSVKVFASGYEEGDNANFGSKGTATFQQEIVCAAESVTYPLVLLFNKINGLSFPDQPETAERISAGRLILNSDEDMAAFEKSMYLTGKYEDALYTADDVYNMTAMNSKATYKGLVDAMAKLTIDDVMAKQK